MKFNSIDMAAHIARLCVKHNFSYNNTKIQKLLYCCYGCVLAKYGERLCDEYPRAWQYGPVFPRVFNFIHKKRNLMERDPLPIEVELNNFLDEVIKTFGKYNAVPLSNWTHKEGSPWDTVVNKMGEGLNGFIPDDIVEEYFKTNVLVPLEENNAN